MELRRVDNMIHLRRRLSSHYETNNFDPKSMSRIQKLTYKMLAPARPPRLKAKAAKTRNLLPLLGQS
eukprot:3940369-Pyramimonas_sp.AAC.1